MQSYNFTKWLSLNESSEENLLSKQFDEWKGKIESAVKNFSKSFLEKGEEIPGFLSEEQKQAFEKVKAEGLDDEHIIKFRLPSINFKKIRFDAFSDATTSCFYGLGQKKSEYDPDISGKTKRKNVRVKASRLAKAAEEQTFKVRKLSHTSLSEFLTRTKSGTFESFLETLARNAGQGFRAYLSGGHRNIAKRTKTSREEFARKNYILTKEVEDISKKLRDGSMTQEEYDKELERIKQEQEQSLGVSNTYSPTISPDTEDKKEAVSIEYIKHYSGKPDLVYSLFNFLVNCILQTTMGNIRNDYYFSNNNSQTGDGGDGESEAPKDDQGVGYLKGGQISSNEDTPGQGPAEPVQKQYGMRDLITKKENSLLNILKQCIFVFLENSKNIDSVKGTVSAKFAISKAAFTFRYLLARIEKDKENFISDLTDWVEKEMIPIMSKGKRASVKAIVNVNDLYDAFVANVEPQLLKLAASICYHGYKSISETDALDMLPSIITKEMIVEAYGFEDYMLFKEACDPNSKYCIAGNSDHQKINNLADKIFLTSQWPNPQVGEFYTDNLKNVIFHAYKVWDARNTGNEGPPIEDCGKITVKRKDVGFGYEHNPEHHKAAVLKLAGGLTPEDVETLNSDFVEKLKTKISGDYEKLVVRERNVVTQKENVNKFLTPSNLSSYLKDLINSQNVVTRLQTRYGNNAKPAVQYLIKQLMEYINETHSERNPLDRQEEDDEDQPYTFSEE